MVLVVLDNERPCPFLGRVLDLAFDDFDFADVVVVISSGASSRDRFIASRRLIVVLFVY